MEKYHQLWRMEKRLGTELTQGEAADQVQEVMVLKRENPNNIRKRLKRRFNSAMANRFGREALWAFWEWGLMNDSVRRGIAAARQQTQAEDEAAAAAADAGSASSGGLHPAAAPTKEALAARRRAKNIENQEARKKAAHHPSGYCNLCWHGVWWERRTECVHCQKLVGECCQAVVEGKFYLICQRCVQDKGVMGPLVGRLQEGLPRRETCHNHRDRPAQTKAQCVDCLRWLCALCVKEDGHPFKCRDCPEVVRVDQHFDGTHVHTTGG